jgi:DNA (cytosine-5)-methyltransferase 1
MQTIDLFSGCGGMSLGFQNAGFEIKVAFDKWDAAINVYQQNFDHPIHQVDLSDAKAAGRLKQYTPEIIIGGPPCQDFSSAGKRDETLGRADLTVTFAEIVADIRPNWFVMENVERIKKSHVLKTAKAILRKAGYGLTEEVLLASHCGVPQSRKRYFLVGELGGQDNSLLPYYKKNMTQKPMTVHDYLGDSLGIEHYYRHPRSYQRRAIFSIHEPSPTIRGVNRPIPKNYKRHSGDPVPITSALRPLTTQERASIQTFPSNFAFEGTKSQMEQMIGNAVPARLAQFVANCILEYCEDREKSEPLREERYEQLPLL